MRKSIAVVSLVLATAGLLIGCAGRSTTQGSGASGATQQPAAVPASQSRDVPVVAATISARHGPSWDGALGDTVQIDWYDQASGETVSERIAVLAVKRVADPRDGSPYEWQYAIKVRLTSLDEGAARSPIAHQFLQLSDGAVSQDGVAGVGAPGGPDPRHVGGSSVGWLHQRAQEGFTPTEVVLPVVAWRASWSLD